MKYYFVEASENDFCAMCGKNHRKLAIIDGMKLGTSCAEYYQAFRRATKCGCSGQMQSFIFNFAKQYDMIVKMLTLNGKDLK